MGHAKNVEKSIGMYLNQENPDYCIAQRVPQTSVLVISRELEKVTKIYPRAQHRNAKKKVGSQYL